MTETRDIRIRMDLSFPISEEAQADKLKKALQPFVKFARNMKEGDDNQEIGFIDVERCGHASGQKCERIARWEVGKGKVV